MPLNYIIGDATKPIGTGNRIITHCCNDLGYWNAGFVKALSLRWSEPERAYRRGPLVTNAFLLLLAMFNS